MQEPNTANNFNVTESTDMTSVLSSVYIYFLLEGAMVIICILGLVGNGFVIRLLGFQIKRNPFTTYILNLTVADSGVLLSLFSFVILQIACMLNCEHFIYDLAFVLLHLFLMMYFAGQLLLTAISTDRCVAVLFPIWHRCHRPPHLSTTVCVLIWVLCFLLSGVYLILQMMDVLFKGYAFVAIALLSLLLMIVSSVALFTKVCFKSQQQRRGNLLTAILLMLFFFLILAYPVSILIMVPVFHNFIIPDTIKLHAGMLCACLNSSINPLIYFRMANKKRGQSRESMKLAMQRVFQEEEDPREELELRAQTQY